MMISVIVPVYNVEQYLHRCIDSILSQTYDSFELLLMDDGSLDSSGKICDEYETKDVRVKVFHLQNGGPSRARNIGIENSTGDVLAFVDSDDYIHEKMFETMLDAMENAQIVMCNFFQTKAGQSEIQSHKLGNSQYVGQEVQGTFIPAFLYSSTTGLGSCWNKFYQKELITANHIRFDENLIRAEDFWFNFECFRKATRVVLIEAALYFYVQDNLQSTMHKVRETQYQEWVANRRKLMKVAFELNITLDYPRFYRGFLYAVAVYLRQLAKQESTKGKIKDVLLDPFYRNALQFDSLLPFHLKIINKVVKINPTSGYYMYRLWSGIGK